MGLPHYISSFPTYVIERIPLRNEREGIIHSMLVSGHAHTFTPGSVWQLHHGLSIHQSLTSESENTPQNVSFVEIKQDIVALELCLAGTENTFVPQVLVHLLQTL